MTKERWRLVAAIVATLVIVVPLAFMWQNSRMPSEYSVMDMGYLDYGGGPHGSGMGDMPGMDHMQGMPGMHGGTMSVADLVEHRNRKPDVSVNLVARQQQVKLASGRTVDGFTINGTTPGPTIRVQQGDLLEVHLHNQSVSEGITLHWHGVDVPNAEDGVAGVTQDAVAKGADYSYRFVARDPGTYWYHSHQVSHEQVVKGLFGALVVTPRKPDRGVHDVLALAHTYDGVRTLNGDEGDIATPAPAGSHVRVRVINTDSGSVETWASAPYRVVAVDARDLHGPTPVDGKQITVPAGGRADLELRVPDDGTAIRVHVGSTSLVIGPRGSAAPDVKQPTHDLDLLHYGTPAPLGFDPTHPDRHFEYSIGRRPGFVDGKPGLWWSINGHLWPNVPMFVVAEGDVVVMDIENHTSADHPMHLHGHHAVVLSRNGSPSTGSPWWIDSLNVRPGQSYRIAFVADNPGIWMDHCHNLQHAAQGLIAHLMYEGVTEPYRIGGATDNIPE